MKNGFQLCHVTKVFEKGTQKVQALQDMTMTLLPGLVYGVLGPNGAGKTTLLKLLAGQLTPSKGTVLFDGQDIQKRQPQVEQVCFVRENNPYLMGYTAQNLFYAVRMNYPLWNHALEKRMCEHFSIPMKKTLTSLSKGQQAAIHITVGLCSRAPLTIFDEAHAGLDVPSRIYFYQSMMEEQQCHPRTILISTHFMEELSGIIQYILLLNAGQIELEGTLEHILENAFTITGNRDKAMELLGRKKILEVETMGQRFARIHIFDSVSVRERQNLEEAGLDVEPMSLQTWFLHMMGGERNEA